MEPKHFAQQITFLYAEDPAASWDFYEPGERAFLGICRARAPRASDNPRVQGGVVFTFVDPDVEGWHARLKARGVMVPEQVEYSEAYRVTHFFFHDPAGYLLEVQRFERPDWPDPAP